MSTRPAPALSRTQTATISQEGITGIMDRALDLPFFDEQPGGAKKPGPKALLRAILWTAIIDNENSQLKAAKKLGLSLNIINYYLMPQNQRGQLTLGMQLRRGIDLSSIYNPAASPVTDSSLTIEQQRDLVRSIIMLPFWKDGLIGFNREILRAVLIRTGNYKDAAKLLGTTSNYIGRQMKKLDLRKWWNDNPALHIHPPRELTGLRKWWREKAELVSSAYAPQTVPDETTAASGPCNASPDPGLEKF